VTEAVADLVVVGASEVVTCSPETGEGKLGRIERGAVAVGDRRISWVGPEAELSAVVRQGPDTVEIDAGGRSVVPGFVDAHTHLVFAGTRREEFSARAAGRPYEAGGILQTVAATRAAPSVHLLEEARARADAMIAAGTTTVEAKSGYALEVDGEKRLLEALRELDGTHPLDLEITFCGAHAVPGEFEGRPDDYLDLVCGEMLAACAPLARWCDVFCDVGAFTSAQARRVLEAGKSAGLTPRIHANELGSTGGAGVAVAVGAASADHLLFLRPSEARALANAGCVAVLAPVTALGLGRTPNVRLMRNAGLQIALATDLNPGMAPSADLQLVLSIATRTMAMDPEDGLLAITAGGAAALRRDDIGRIAPGCLADLVILAGDHHLDLGYHAGTNLAATVIKRGEVVA